MSPQQTVVILWKIIQKTYLRKPYGEECSNNSIKGSIVMVGTPVAKMMRYTMVVDTAVVPAEIFKAVVLRELL